jgi:hypothetical protein
VPSRRALLGCVARKQKEGEETNSGYHSYGFGDGHLRISYVSAPEVLTEAL